jgi:hypothetical protein
MARLPTRDDLGELPSARSGRPIATIDARAAGAVGQGVAAIGEALTETGKKLYQKQDQTEEADIERRVLEFTRDRERDLQERRRTMEAGGDGFADTWRSGYDESAREVFGRARTEGLSHRALQRLDIGLLRAGERLHTRAYEYQNQEYDRYNREDVNNRIAGVIGSFATRDDLIANAEDYLARGRTEIEALIRTGRLSAADRYQVRRSAMRLFDERMLQAMQDMATTPELRAEVRRLSRGMVREPTQPPPGRRRPPGSDFDRPPPGDQTTPPPAGEWRTEVTPETFGRRIHDFFVAQGLQPHQAAALAGNMVHEGGGRTDQVNPSDNPRYPANPHSIGIGQWNGPRQRALVEFARARGVQIPDGNLADVAVARRVAAAIPLETQLEFAWSELQGAERGALARLRAATDVEGANRAAIGYHRPRGWTAENPDAGHAFSGRLANARQILSGTTQTQPPGDQTTTPPPVAPPPPTGLLTPAVGVDIDRIRFERPDRVNPVRVPTYVIEADGQFVVIPGFDERGRRIAADEAVRRYRTTDQHLGAFDTRENALAYQTQLRDGPAGMDRARYEGGQDDQDGGRSLFQYAHGAQRRVANRMDMLDRQDATAVDQQINRWEREIREGNLPPREEFSRVLVRAQSLPNGDALRERLEAVGRYGLFMHELMRLSPQEMVEEINRVRQVHLANPNTSETAWQWLRTAEQFVNRIDGQIRSNTIELANRRGIANFGAIDYTNKDSMDSHAAGLRLIEAWLGRPSPRVFSDLERDRALAIMRRGGDEMLNLVGSMTRHWGQDVARRAIQELATADNRSGDVNELVTAGMMFVHASDNPALMPAARALAQAIRDRAENPEVRQAIQRMITAPDRTDAASILDTAYQLSNRTRESVLAAADLLYYQRASSRNITTFDPRLYQQGIRDILGESTQGNRTYGGLYYQNWRGNRDPIVVPPNMRREGVRHALEVLNLWDITDENGLGPVGSDGRYVTMDALRRMTMVSAGNGVYRFAEGDPRTGNARWVTNGAGQPFELDVNRLGGTEKNPGPLRQRMPEMYRGYEEGVPGAHLPDSMNRDWRGPRIPGAAAIRWLTEATDQNREQRIREFDRTFGEGRARGMLEALSRRQGQADAAPERDPFPETATDVPDVLRLRQPPVTPDQRGPRQNPNPYPESGTAQPDERGQGVPPPVATESADHIWEPGGTTPRAATTGAAEELRRASSRADIDRILDRYTVRTDEAQDAEERDAREEELSGGFFGMYSHRRHALILEALRPYLDATGVRTDLSEAELRVVNRLVPLFNELTARYNTDQGVRERPRNRAYHQNRSLQEYLQLNPDTHLAPRLPD